MRSPRWVFVGLACAGLLLGAGRADGQTAAAQADALFDKALEAKQAGRYDEACPALAESQRLDPRPGTLFALGDCEALLGKSASAVAHLKEFLRIVDGMQGDLRRRYEPRARLAKQKVDELEPQVPTLTLTLPGELPPGVVVLQDGIEIGRAALGTALPIDPGEHVIVTRAPGRLDAEQRVTIAPRDATVVELSLGAPDPRGEQSPAPVKKKTPINIRKTATYGLLGVGAAGLVVGGVMGGLAVAQKGTVDEHCNGLNCDETGFTAVGRLRSFGTASTVLLVLGGAAAVGGGVLLLTTPKAPKGGVTAQVRTNVGPGGAFLSLEGAF